MNCCTPCNQLFKTERLPHKQGKFSRSYVHGRKGQYRPYISARGLEGSLSPLVLQWSLHLHKNQLTSNPVHDVPEK